MAVTERTQFYSERGVLHEDVEACYEILAKWDFGFVHEPLMIVGTDAKSLTSTAVKPMRKLLASNLDLLATYGPMFLDEVEFATRMDQKIADYYEQLALGIFDLQGPEFWRFHREALGRAGHRMSTTRMLGAIISAFIASPIGRTRQLARTALKRQPVRVGSGMVC